MIRRGWLGELAERPTLIEAAANATGSSPVVNWQALEALDVAGMLRVLVVEIKGQIVGFAVAVVSDEFFGLRRSCTTLSFYVAPPHGALVLSLLRELANRAAIDGCSLFRLQVLAGSRLDLHLRRQGWKRASVAYEIVPSAFVWHYADRHGPSSDRHRGARVQRLHRGDAALGGIEG